MHALRDYLQMKGINNWFTEFGHIWKKPEWEKYSAVFFSILGLILLFFAIRN